MPHPFALFAKGWERTAPARARASFPRTAFHVRTIGKGDAALGLRLAIGFSLIGLAVLLDAFMRLRLRDLGARNVFLRGGTLDYGMYFREAKQRGWSMWPVYLLIPLFLAGVNISSLGLIRVFIVAPAAVTDRRPFLSQQNRGRNPGWGERHLYSPASAYISSILLLNCSSIARLLSLRLEVRVPAAADNSSATKRKAFSFSN